MGGYWHCTAAPGHLRSSNAGGRRSKTAPPIVLGQRLVPVVMPRHACPATARHHNGRPERSTGRPVHTDRSARPDHPVRPGLTTIALAARQTRWLDPPTGAPVLTGELMTPLLSTRHPWHVGLGDRSIPPALSGDYDVVRVNMGLGLPAIETMVDTGRRVGPVLYCVSHQILIVPVSSGTAYTWGAAHSTCSRGQNLECVAQGYQSRCSRVWLTLPAPDAASITAPAALHDALSVTRARLQTTGRQPFSMCRREVCHV